MAIMCAWEHKNVYKFPKSKYIYTYGWDVHWWRGNIARRAAQQMPIVIHYMIIFFFVSLKYVRISKVYFYTSSLMGINVEWQ